MKKHFLLFLYNLLIISYLTTEAQEIIYRKKFIQEDIIFLKKELEQYHPNLYKYTSKARFDFICDSLTKNAPETANIQTIFIHLLKMVNEIKCGHTTLSIDWRFIPMPKSDRDIFFNGNSSKFFPFEIYLKEDRVFISRSYVKDKYQINRGDEILTINKIPVKEVLKIVNSYNFQHGDGNNSSSQKYFLLTNFKFLLYIWRGNQEVFYLDIKKQEKKQVENVVVPPLFLTEMLQIDAKRNFENEYDENSLTFAIIDSLPKTAYIRIKSFLKAGNKSIFFSGYEKETSYLFNELKNEKIENLIIDLRGNTGGNLKYATNFLSFLIPKPFKFPQVSVREKAISKIDGEDESLFASNPKKHFKIKSDNDFWDLNYSNNLVIPSKELFFKGNIYVLINGGTYSAASYFASKLKDVGIGTFIGTPTGGAFDNASAGFFSEIKLPNSQLKINLPLARVKHNVDLIKYPYSHLKPDFEVGLSFEDFLKKQDTSMNYTVDLIKQGKKTR